MSFRFWMSLVTAVLLGLIIYFAWSEIVHAWQLLVSINVWILVLLIPVQLFAYFAAGEMTFSYLRAKQATARISLLNQMRMALEMNFVNHVLPSGGVSGISYMNWRLKRYGISAGKATAAQMVRYFSQFASFLALLLIAVTWITLDGNMNRWIVLISGFVALVMTVGTALAIVLISSRHRSTIFSGWLTRNVNRLVKRLTFRKVKTFLNKEKISHFLFELHDEYLVLRHDRRLLLRPFLWGIALNVFDAMLFVITFWALGTPVSPAPILIAYGLGSIAAVLVVTPGGTGVYEAVMVSFLATAGVGAGVAIAGILVTRVALLLGTIGLGYAFYQHAIIKYGKRTSHI
jgi:uncharacterized protein (TIRG00374 family)